MTFERHEHSWVSGPRAHFSDNHFVHSHELPAKFHRHPCTGPGAFRVTGKPTARPLGEQLRFIDESERRFFKVVMEPTYTGEHERAGVSRDMFAAQLADFQAVVAGQLPPMRGPGAISMTVARLQDNFGVEAIYEVSDGGAWCCGKPMEEHPRSKAGWYCPEGQEADRQHRERVAARTAAELAEMGWAS